jgi:chemotaxis protein histidine kinase CheA/CheY-like chemotaxis protein
VLPQDDNDLTPEYAERCSRDASRILAALGQSVTPQVDATLPPNLQEMIQAARDAHTPSSRPTKGRAPGQNLPTPPPPAQLQLDSELLTAFLEDAQRGVTEMEQSLLELDSNPAHAESLQQLGRALHTMKGASASVGLAELAHYMHELEDFLQRSNASEQGGLNIQVLLQGVDTIRTQMESLAPSSKSLPLQIPATPASHNDTTPRLGSEPPVAPLSVVSHPVTAGSSKDSIRVDAARLDRLMDLLGELVISRNRRDTQVGRLKQLHTELMRTITRLRMLSESMSDAPVLEARSDATTKFTQHDSEAPSSQFSPHLGTEIANDVSEIARALRELYEPVMDENLAASRLMGQFRHELMELRRLPLSGLFLRLQRAARDAAHAEGKHVQFELRGEHAGLEPALQERLYEPLLHLVRNAVSHGIENDADRIAKGKSPAGTVTIETRGDPTSLVIEVRDDGKGLDYEAIQRRGLESGLLERDRPASTWQLAQLIFHPGFSTRREVTEVSGRGVGMDVVANVLDRLRGQIEVESSPGNGTAIRLRIPLRSSIEHTMVYRVDGRLFALPMQFVQAARSAGPDVKGSAPRGDHTFPDVSRPDLPVVRVRDLLALDTTPRPTEEHTLIVSQGDSARTRPAPSNSSGRQIQPTGRIALMVDSVVGPEEVVVRSLPPLFKRHRLLAGVTLSGAGEIVLLLDGNEMIERATLPAAALPEPQIQPKSPAGCGASAPRRALVADDSVSVRRSLSRMLERRGFTVNEAADGLEALDLLRTFTYSIVLTDLEMPRLGGMELLSEIRRSRRKRPLSVIVVSSVKGQEVEDRVKELGADAFVPKPVTDANLAQLLASVRLDGASE